MAPTGLIRKQWTQWFLLFLFWTVLGLAFAGQLYLARSKIGDPVTWGFALERALADWYVFAFLSIPALWLARRFPLEFKSWGRGLVTHLPASAAFSVAWMALRAALEHWQSRGDMRPIEFAEAFTHKLGATFFLNLLIYWVIILVRQAFDYYRRLHEGERHAAELERRLAEARLQALQMQLNPHFLFNTLNAISSLMHKDVEEADRMIVHLSDLLRYALESTDAQKVPLRQELDFLDRYLKIQQARFGERLVIRQEVPEETLDALVPNLVLQPLVENAIEHGVAPHARPGKIVLRACHRENRLELEVQDNGDGLPPEEPLVDGIGLSNTRARLLQLYGLAHDLQLANGDGGGLTVRIRIPWQTEPGAQVGV